MAFTSRSGVHQTLLSWLLNQPISWTFASCTSAMFIPYAVTYPWSGSFITASSDSTFTLWFNIASCVQGSMPRHINSKHFGKYLDKEGKIKRPAAQQECLPTAVTCPSKKDCNYHFPEPVSFQHPSGDIFWDLAKRYMEY